MTDAFVQIVSVDIHKRGSSVRSYHKILLFFFFA